MPKNPDLLFYNFNNKYDKYNTYDMTFFKSSCVYLNNSKIKILIQNCLKTTQKNKKKIKLAKHYPKKWEKNKIG